MQYHQLGNSSLRVSEIGFGCMSLPIQKEAESIRIINRAVELGINYFDTADLYDHGHNEELLGKAVKTNRKELVIATKVGNKWKPDGSGFDWNPRKKYIIACVDNSLRRLQTDYIDLYQLHGGTIDDPIDEVIEAFELLKQQGKILQYGISSIRPNVIREYVKRSSIVSVMMQYSMIDRRPEETILDLLQQNNISVLSRGALAQGMLINKPAKDYLGYTAKEISAAANAVKNNSTEKNTPAQTAIRFVLQHPAVASAVIGCSSIIQLEDAAAISPKLSAREVQSLKAALIPKVYEQHR